MARLILEGLSKTFGGIVAVRDIDLEAKAGEHLFILGPSGSGKTTILRLIAGLDSPSQGRILIDGRDVAARPPRERDVAMVFQDGALFPHLRVADNLAFGLRARGMARAAIRQRVEGVARALGIAGLLDRRPGELSGGERRRVAIGRALVRTPSLILLDEPFASLDPPLRARLRGVLARTIPPGATTIEVTHHGDEGLASDGRIAILHRGAIEQVGRPAEIYARPANAFVAGFIGRPPMNLASAVVSRGTGETVLHLAGFPATVDARRFDVGTRRSVLVGIRPEALLPAAPEPGRLEGVVASVEFVGRETVLRVRAGGEMLAAIAPPGERPRPGETISLRFAEEDIYLFDEVDGRSLAAKGPPGETGA
ncbi:MAG: ABC transporter ATP-binding protein [Planctomycetes bacterium]|nr:ABC transporter ATP-binding protein [Planctomycetota bacterium]